jgi:hypothetical protein
MMQKILPFFYLIKQAKLMFMHSVKYEYCPKSYRDVFSRVNVDDLAYNLHYPNNFEIPRPRIELFKRMPIYTGTLPQEWNDCEELRFYQNPLTFKITLVETLFRMLAEEHNLTGEQLY